MEKSQPFLMIITCLKFLKLSPWTPLSVFDIFLLVCLFPRALEAHKWMSQNPKFEQKSKFSPKSQKINICWFLSKFHRQSFRRPHKVPLVWFLWSYDFFWQNYEILKKNFFSKKKKFEKKNFSKKKNRAFFLTIFFFLQQKWQKKINLWE